MMALGAMFETPGHTNSITFYDRRTPDQKQQWVIQDASHPNPQWRILDVPHSGDSGRIPGPRIGVSWIVETSFRAT